MSDKKDPKSHPARAVPNGNSNERSHPCGRADDDPNAKANERSEEQLFRSFSSSAVQVLWHLMNDCGNGPTIYTKGKEIEMDTGVSLSSAKRSLKFLERNGFLTKKHYRYEADQGLEITLLPICERFRHFATSYVKYLPIIAVSFGRSSFRLKDRSINQIPFPQEVRQILAITHEEFTSSFPHVYEVGFHLSMLTKIARQRANLGEDCKHLVQGLRYVEYALEHDLLRDRNDNPIEKPASWIYKVLLKQGYHPIPKGYKTPEQMAAEDSKWELTAIKRAEEEHKQAEYEIWLKTLPKAKAAEIVAHGFGPDQARLRHHWEKTVWNTEEKEEEWP